MYDHGIIIISKARLKSFHTYHTYRFHAYLQRNGVEQVQICAFYRHRNHDGIHDHSWSKSFLILAMNNPNGRQLSIQEEKVTSQASDRQRLMWWLWCMSGFPSYKWSTQNNQCGFNLPSSSSAKMDIQFYSILASAATRQCQFRQLSGSVWIKAWIFLWGMIAAAVFCSLLLSTAHLRGAQSWGNTRFIRQNNADWSPTFLQQYSNDAAANRTGDYVCYFQ